MHIKFISQRSTRTCLPVLVFLTLCILLLTASRLRSGSRLPQATLRAGEHRKGVEREKGENSRHDSPTKRPKLKPGQCSSDVEFLRRPELGLTERVLYTRRCIKPIRGKVDRDVLTNMSTPLVDTGKMTTVNLTSCSHDNFPPCEPLPLHVPEPYPQKQYPHLIFGVASNYGRMQNSLDSFSHWLSGTGAQLYGIIADADEPNKNFNLTSLEETYRKEDILATFVSPAGISPVLRQQDEGPNGKDHNPNRPVPIEHHHFMLVRELLSRSNPDQTRWLAIVDDDTFFPSLYPLDCTLAQYDHTKPQWLGALSDDFDAVKLWGFMAFGGAGVFLSLPLARQIEPHTEKCITDTTIHTGDGILRDCIYSHSRTKLTVVPGLYQHDFRGDASGFFESGVGPLSVHHWKSWYKEPMPKMAAVGGVCGGCWLQRWKFDGGGKGGDMLLANGYSITEYPLVEGITDHSGHGMKGEGGSNGKKGKGGLDYVDLARIEGTWLHPTQEYDFSYGPLRPKLGEERKKSWKLVDVHVDVAVVVDGNGRRTGPSANAGEVITSFRQIYVHRKSDAWEVDEGAMDEVIELIWEV